MESNLLARINLKTMRLPQVFSFLAVLGMAFVEAKDSNQPCRSYKDCVKNCDSGDFYVRNPNSYPEFACAYEGAESVI
ncbi:hypothetical protein N7452_003063 [Penicillium brevicompactum]|uniref:Uncharacterized protein n=1 Tax=Penicillium brevicompactum TaxID=5074 RepID=A0A9W9QUC2_PENBR|nr:hypothetical protein N7452_003063 [Penicillium brevicompactum]